MTEAQAAWLRIEGDIARITLTKGYTAVIDTEDVPLVLGTRWHAKVKKGKTVYAVGAVPDASAHQGRRLVLLHRLILQAKTGQQVDHADQDGLNNRRGNLRFCDRFQNQQNRGITASNTSGFKGVNFDKLRGRWHARISHSGKRTFLGYFDAPEEAAAAYASAAKKIHGAFCPAGLAALAEHEKGVK